MTSPRWRKVLADLKLSRSRTILVILSIAIGIFAVGTMLTSRVVLQQGVDDTLDAANPASAVLMTQPFGEDVLTSLRALPEIADAEGRATIQVRIQVGEDAWRDLDLTAIADFNDMRIDRVMPESGAWPPATGEILIERASLSDAGVVAGDDIVIETPEGTVHALRVGGVAFDPGKVTPTFSEDRLFGYITLETLASLGQPAVFNEVHIQAAEQPRDLQQGELVAGIARDQVLEANGITVHRIAVQDTPRYHSASLTDAIILILGLLGGLVLLLGVFLVINTVSALLTQQVRQIGIMKAIGGQRRQIVAIFIGLVLAYGVLGAIIAIPLTALAAWQFTRVFSDMLNLTGGGSVFPPGVVALEIALGLLVPVLAALVPVLRGTRLTVREAVTSYGLSDGSSTGSRLDGAIERLRVLPRPVILSLRNTFRRRGRLALTLATLTLGGALFASVTTIQSSLDRTLEGVLNYSDYDVEINLSQSEPFASAIQEAESVPGVQHAEAWIATNASRIRPDGTQNSNVWLVAPPADSELIQPTLVEGRWLQPNEGEAVVVNADFRSDEPDIRVGDLVTLRVEGHELRWPVIGVVSSQLMGPVVFVPYEPFSNAIGLAGSANRIVLVTGSHAVAAQTDAANLTEQRLRAGGLPVERVDTQRELRAGTESIFTLVVIMLLVVGGLLVIVGAIGLTGAMSLNVLERTREIGVMRAIGAANGMIARIVIVEGVVVGLLGWLLGALLALPLSWMLSNAIGRAFLQAPLDYRFSVAGILIWLVLVLALAVLASLLPARSAWRLSVRQALAYE